MAPTKVSSAKSKGKAAPKAKPEVKPAPGGAKAKPAKAAPKAKLEGKAAPKAKPKAKAAPKPVQKAAARSPVKKAARAAAKASVGKAATKPSASKASKPSASKASKPSATKAAATKPAASKPSATKAAATKPAASKPASPSTAQPAIAKSGAPKKQTAPASTKHAGAAAVAAPVPAEASDAIPTVIGGESTDARRMLTARERMTRSLPVLEILEDPHPIGALRRFLDSIKGEATQQQAQIALGSAQLMLLPSAREHDRGTQEVRELVDLVVRHWEDFGERRLGFHAQEFLRNALSAIGVDRDRIARLAELIPPHPTTELLFNLACAHAVARDKVAMLRAVETALEAGASPADFRREADFAPYANDPDLAILLTRAEVPPIPVDIDPYLPGVRAALDSLLSTLKEFGESVELRPGVRLDAILDAERAGKVSLPNDYRALLTLTNGMRLWEHEFFGAGDYREHTKLSTRAQHYLELSFGVTGLVECVPVANWGQPNDWLLYDPRGRLRGGEAGYVLRVDAIEEPVEDLAAALIRMEHLAREVLGTN